MLADGTELDVVHAKDAANFQILVDVVPVERREGIAVAPVNVGEVEDGAGSHVRLQPGQRVVGSANQEGQLLVAGPRCAPGRPESCRLLPATACSNSGAWRARQTRQSCSPHQSRL